MKPQEITIRVRSTRRLAARTPLSWHCNNRRQIQFVFPRGKNSSPARPPHSVQPRGTTDSPQLQHTPAPLPLLHMKITITITSSPRTTAPIAAPTGSYHPAFRNAIPLSGVLCELGIRRLHEFAVDPRLGYQISPKHRANERERERERARERKRERDRGSKLSQ
jgi:hypothetical protein